MITWTTHAYGREHDLEKLNRQRNDHHLGPKTRLGADRAHTKINRQLRDKYLMRLRSRLLKATIAGDHQAVGKIELLIRDHLGEAREAFSGHKDY